MKFTANQIAKLLEGSVHGNPKVEVFSLSKIENGTPGSLSFLSNPKYKPYIYKTEASVVLVNRDFVPEGELKVTLIKVQDAYKSFSKLLTYYDGVKQQQTGIESPVFISKTVSYGKGFYLGAFSYLGSDVKIGNNTKIYPNCYIGNNVKIGHQVVIYPGVKIYSDTVVGNHCTIHAGCVIGADGFGFAPDASGTFQKIPQTGNVIIEDHVDIGASTTVDRATLGSTIVRKGVKLDNQIQVAHNVEIGKNTVIAAQTGIAGSTKIGEHCMIGGQVGIIGHITIGNNVKVQAQTGIARNVKDNETLQGTPALSYADFNKSYVYFKNLPKLVKKIEEVEKILKNDSKNG